METKVINYTEGRLDEALRIAKERADESLQKCIDRLMNYGADILILSNDYAPLSFDFGLFRASEQGEYVIEGIRCYRSINGGVIFHGKHDNGGDGSAPTFAVSLTPVNGWSIHT